MSADEIIVLRDGTIAERGTHGELLTAGGLYAGMWERQLEANEAEAVLARERREREEREARRRQEA